MGLISAGTTIFDAGSLNAGGAMTFIKKITASSSSTISFVHGSSSVVFDGTRPIRSPVTKLDGSKKVLLM